MRIDEVLGGNRGVTGGYPRRPSSAGGLRLSALLVAMLAVIAACSGPPSDSPGSPEGEDIGQTSQASSTPLPETLTGDSANIYHLTRTNELKWYRDLRRDGGLPSSWHANSGSNIGQGIPGAPDLGTLRSIVSGAQGQLYAIDNAGNLKWYGHTGEADGSAVWHPNSGNTIGTGWGVAQRITASPDGTIYVIFPSGELRWYKDICRNGTPFTPSCWHSSSGTTIGSGWASAPWVIADEDGVIYLIDAAGQLKWYRHRGPISFPAWTWDANSGSTIGWGWNTPPQVFSGRAGILYIVDRDGNLRWYQDTNRLGQFGWAANSGAIIKAGWPGLHAVRVCQLSGQRASAWDSVPTGMERGPSGPRTITGGDLGASVEHKGRLHFFFGDTRDFSPDRCEPNKCGVQSDPSTWFTPIPDSGRISRWTSFPDYKDAMDLNGLATESVASAPISGLDPVGCIPLDVPMEGTQGKFRPVRLDGKTLPRQEGVFSAFSDDNLMYAFFTKKSWPLGCPLEDGCAHDSVYDYDANPSTLDQTTPGGKLVLANSNDDGKTFDSMMTFSSTKFLYASPSIALGSTFPGLPQDLQDPGKKVVFVFGSGRPINEGAPPLPPKDEWYPYLAVTALGDVTRRDSEVRAYQTTSIPPSIGDAAPLTAPPVATNQEDRWVLADNSVWRRIVVITRGGSVWAHPVGSSVSSVQPATNIGTISVDGTEKWVLFHNIDRRLFVIRSDGSVKSYSADANGNYFSSGVTLSGPPNGLGVGKRNDDNWVVSIGSKLVVINKRGRVFLHEISGNSILNATEASLPDGNVAGAEPPASHRDPYVFALGSRLAVVTGNGKVITYNVHDGIVDGRTALNPDPNNPNGSGGVPRVAANPQDRWLLYFEPTGQQLSGRLVVVNYKPASNWRYYTRTGGTDGWSVVEGDAAPLRPWGDPSIHGDLYHKCLGYYSVRYFSAIAKWVMLYACDRNLDLAQGEQRGIHLRTSSTPWGPWSAPVRILTPGLDTYCAYMYLIVNNVPGACAPNPFEEEKIKRSGSNVVREPGGEYAPLLLPSTFASQAGGETTFYYTLSTWNPYQTVLMKEKMVLP